MARPNDGKLAVKSALVWVVMVVVLILVPDALERWMPLDIARVCGWVLASGVWVALVEREWRERFGPISRFVFQLLVWLSAAILATTISDNFKVSHW